MNGHHLILGELEDFLTGDTLKDTHDERYRQSLARMLIQVKGYRRKDVHSRAPLAISVDHKKAALSIDFVIQLSSRIEMIIQYSPGSIVTRHRPILALTRLLAPYQIPVAVATNGEEADVLDATSGELWFSGLAAIPSRSHLMEITRKATFQPIKPKQAEMESRILYAYEIDGRCPCDDTVCRI